MANKPTVFNGATGAKSPVVTAHVIAFIKANNGLGNVALQLTPNAIGKNGVLFGGHCEHHVGFEFRVVRALRLLCKIVESAFLIFCCLAVF